MATFKPAGSMSPARLVRAVFEQLSGGRWYAHSPDIPFCSAIGTSIAQVRGILRTALATRFEDADAVTLTEETIWQTDLDVVEGT